MFDEAPNILSFGASPPQAGVNTKRNDRTELYRIFGRMVENEDGKYLHYGDR